MVIWGMVWRELQAQSWLGWFWDLSEDGHGRSFGTMTVCPQSEDRLCSTATNATWPLERDASQGPSGSMLTHTTEVHPQKECHQSGWQETRDFRDFRDFRCDGCSADRQFTCFWISRVIYRTKFFCVLCLEFGCFTHITVDDCEIQGKPPWMVFQHIETKKHGTFTTYRCRISHPHFF